MKLGLIQFYCVPADVEKNIAKAKEMFKEAALKGAQLIAFPELFSCGYELETPQFEMAVSYNEEILKDFCLLAAEYKTVVILPLPQKIEGKLYIGLYVIESSGKIIREYQKSFIWGREHGYFVHGKRVYEPVDTSLGRIGVLICYDMEFPEPSRILTLKGAEIIFAPSVWSFKAQHRWEVQFAARALDNTVFVAGINQVKNSACGNTKLLSPYGEIIARASETKEEVLICEADMSLISKARKDLPYLKDYDMDLCPGRL